MNTDSVNKWLTLAANIGVIAGIIFLAIEVQQNNEALGVQARLSRENVLREGIARRMLSPELLRATVKAQENEELNGEEVLILGEFNFTALMDFGLIYQQVQDDLLEENSPRINQWRNVFHTYPLMSDSWAKNKAIFPLGFIQWFEQNVIQAGPL